MRRLISMITQITVIVTMIPQGKVSTEALYDRTHITPTGARYVAGIIVNSMKEQLPHFSTFVK